MLSHILIHIGNWGHFIQTVFILHEQILICVLLILNFWFPILYRRHMIELLIMALVLIC